MSSKSGIHETDLPPSYTDAAALAPTRGSHSRPAALLPDIDFYSYRLPQATLTDDRTTVTTRCLKYVDDPSALLKMLYEQAALPPRQLLRIVGRTQTAGYPTKTNFDLTLNMMGLFAAPEGASQHLLQVKNVHSAGSTSIGVQTGDKDGQDSHADLKEWTQRFCVDGSGIKTFKLERKVGEWDQPYIEGQLRILIAAMKYPGTLTVTFPVTFSSVVVASGEDGRNWFQKSFNLVPAKATKHYTVMETVWPARQFSFRSTTEAHSRPYMSGEHEWWMSWQDAIRNAMLTGVKGYVTMENWLDVAMGYKAPDRTGWSS